MARGKAGSMLRSMASSMATAASCHGSGRLATRMREAHRLQLLPGTLEMLILQTLIFGPRHGHGIATTIQRTSDQALLVDHGSLYPALQRLERAGLMDSAWGASENNRRARFYTITAAGRKQLEVERRELDRMILAIHQVLES